MTITREQLEKAAKQAGIDGRYYAGMFDSEYRTGILWDESEVQSRLFCPHKHHGHLLDLAIACKICIEPRYNLVKYQIERTGLYVSRSVNCKDFPALAEAVILACCEQFDAKGGE